MQSRHFPQKAPGRVRWLGTAPAFASALWPAALTRDQCEKQKNAMASDEVSVNPSGPDPAPDPGRLSSVKSGDCVDTLLSAPRDWIGSVEMVEELMVGDVELE